VRQFHQPFLEPTDTQKRFTFEEALRHHAACCFLIARRSGAVMQN
jgi:hypothetical protein